MTHSVALLALWLMLAASACGREATSTAASEVQPIVQIGQRTITYAEIRCDRAQTAPSDDSACVAVEQERLDRITSALLIDQAAQLYGVSVSMAEAAAAVPSDPKADAKLRKVDREFKIVAKAVLRIIDGADPADVYHTDVESQGISRAFFDSARARWSRTAAERVLMRDMVAEAKRDAVEGARQRLTFDRLRIAARKRAVARHEDESQVWHKLWADVAEKSPVRVFDHRYAVIDMEKFK